jgi:hypothetical protein
LLASAVRESEADRIEAWTEPMTHEDPRGRPTAAMVVHALASCAPPEVVLLPAVGVASALRRAASRKGEIHDRGAGEHGDVEHGAGEHGDVEHCDVEHCDVDHGRAERRAVVPLRESRWWRLRLNASRSLKRFGAGVAALGLVGGLGVGVAWVTHSGPWARASAATAAEQPGSVDGGLSTIAAGNATGLAVPEPLQAPDDAAERLTVARFDALARGDGDALVALTVAGSPARADAESTATSLRNGLLRVDGLAGSVEDSVRLGGAGDGALSEADTAVVRVRYRLGPHAVVAGGETTTYDGYEQTVDLTVEWVEGSGWLVSDAATVEAPGG